MDDETRIDSYLQIAVFQLSAPVLFPTPISLRFFSLSFAGLSLLARFVMGTMPRESHTRQLGCKARTTIHQFNELLE